MTPVLRLYWIIALVITPLTFWWLLVSLGSDYTLASFLSSSIALLFFLLALSWTLLGTYEVFFCESNLRRNYPVLVNLRYLLEFSGPRSNSISFPRLEENHLAENVVILFTVVPRKSATPFRLVRNKTFSKKDTEHCCITCSQYMWMKATAGFCLAVRPVVSPITRRA